MIKYRIAWRNAKGDTGHGRAEWTDFRTAFLVAQSWSDQIGMQYWVEKVDVDESDETKCEVVPAQAGQEGE